MNNPIVINGVVHGKIIELESEPGLADGQSVSVTLDVPRPLPEGLRRAFGSCADEAESLDAFVEETYRLRDLERSAEMRRQAGLEP